MVDIKNLITNFPSDYLSSDQVRNRRSTRRRNSTSISTIFKEDKNKRNLTDRRLIIANYDRRISARLQDGFKVIVKTINTHKEEQIVGEAVDLSSSGLKLLTKEKIPLGEKILINFALPNFFTQIQILGSTEWRHPLRQKNVYLHGISFFYSENADIENLSRYIKLKPSKVRNIPIVNSIDDFSWGILKKLISLSELGQKSINGKADLGVNFDHIYSNNPRGKSYWGKIIDWLLLNLPAAKASRNRKDTITKMLINEIQKQIVNKQQIRILDVGCGTSRYTTEAIEQIKTNHKIDFVGVDADAETIQFARNQTKNKSFKFIKLDVFKSEKLIRYAINNNWKPSIVICAGFIYYFDDFKVRELIKRIANFMAADGVFILSNLVSNPNRKLIGKIFTTKNGNSWIPVSRKSECIYNWLRKAGFNIIKSSIDKWNMYSIFLAQQNKPENISSTPSGISINSKIVEFRSNNVTYKGEFFFKRKKSLESVVIFIHGLGYTESAYKINPDLFLDRNHGFFRFNLRGHAGNSGEWTLKHAIEDVKAAMMKISQIQDGIPINIFAHSTGALIGLLAAMKLTNLVHKASLVNPVTSIFDSFMHWHESGFNFDVRPFFKLHGEIPIIIKSYLDDKNVIMDFKSGNRNAIELEFPYRYGMLKGQSFRNLSDAIAFSPDLNGLASNIKIPSIIFKGNFDEVIPVEKIEMFFRKLAAEKKLIIGTDSRDHFQSNYWNYITEQTISFFEKDNVTLRNDQLNELPRI